MAVDSKILNDDINEQSAALILSGGGARAAYQAGVLKAVNDILKRPKRSPFSIITGTSAGAINAAAVASNNHQFDYGTTRLEEIWASFTPSHVYRTGLLTLLKNAAFWSWNALWPSKETKRPHSLLDNTPLRELLTNVIRFEDIGKNIEAGLLRAVCTTCYNYNTGNSVSFFEGLSQLVEWKRFRRFGCTAKLNVDHLLASSAIPMVFPSQKIGNAHFGDGSLRFLAPLSPALHLGADKLFVVTVEPLRGEPEHRSTIPTIGDIGGHLFDSIFIDSLESDIERLMRVNSLIAHIPESDLVKEQLPLKPVDAFIISPSIEPAELAGQYFKNLPRGLRFFFKRIGVDGTDGNDILSYLLFDEEFTQHLIDLGYNDAINQQHNILTFFGSEP
ncbi:patatin-like phospholipase family protein [Kangiella sediminilitoris]|uniref:Patatin n=1 Tax=Kangiella sediminilitoris TaxID=1144748 RepID=A0A1B3BC19_9GAMM|nr:patatin-like phospholipase family protein [Kangiella sediminilitoris]AOE50338.1 Patatin [Kangiella sediminilitoris]